MPDEVLVLADDLFFSSKIASTARLCSVTARLLKTPRELLQNADPKRVKLIIIDLNGRMTEPVRAIEELKGSSAGGAIPILAFFSHVQTELAEAARKAGASWILPRSAFSARLAGILTDFKA
jgi:DNA-binding NarL/FixJ family response regulator